jgi:hypothetical protein
VASSTLDLRFVWLHSTASPILILCSSDLMMLT